MNWKLSIFLLLFFSFINVGTTHTTQVRLYTSADSLEVRRIFDEALLRGESYSNLKSLCKDIGHRLTGSPEAERAVNWGYEVLKAMGPDTVYLQKITAPHWVRGDIESLNIIGLPETTKLQLEVCALGGSVGTNGLLVAEVIEVQTLDELKELPEEKVKGKIVFFNRPMERALINTFQAYGGCVDQRYWGAAEAAKYGAVGVLVRSMTTKVDHDPHTGSMAYVDGVKKIPAMALSTSAADLLHLQLTRERATKVSLQMNCETLEDIETYNVVAELRGSEHPEEIMVVGGHLDSWDQGEGAHDDGAGIVHSMEVMRIFISNNIRPKHTLRVVLFMNEENGNFGGKTYAKIAKERNENHIIALESDRGGFTPRGFSIDAGEDQVSKVASFRPLLEPYGLHFFEKGYAGVDIGPLKSDENKVNDKLLMLGLYPDPQRYFDYHHSSEDVLENVNQRELELGSASMASVIYLLDKYWNQINT
ncbi:M20/M25/M40 family metallo-hydrolase [bacterium]|nr:M20/M25/M40 family metallo-hydrolase [bacterium]